MRFFANKQSHLLMICLSSCILFNTNAVSSSSKPHFNVDSKNAWFVGAGGGASFINLPSNTTVLNGSGAPAPYDQDLYSINKPTAGLWQFMVGYRVHQDKTFLPYFSTFFQYRHSLTTQIKGTIDQYSLPDFVNYNYRVKYDADLYMLIGKLNLFQFQGLMPYVSGGVGMISNHLNGYSESALSNVTQRDSPGYGGMTENHAAFSLGVGLDYMITDTIWMTLGYDYVFPYNISTNPGINSWSDTKVNLGNMKTNNVFLNITASFPQDTRS